MSLSPTIMKFVVHWGELGVQWGVNRSVAQVHALLYLSPTPLSADLIATRLSVARSSVSTSLRELLSLRLIRSTRALGDRRDYSEAVQDVWDLFLIILDERKKRGIDPTLELLGECVALAEDDALLDEHSKKRIKDMHRFLGRVGSWYGDLRRVPRATMMKLIYLDAKKIWYLNSVENEVTEDNDR